MRRIVDPPHAEAEQYSRIDCLHALRGLRDRWSADRLEMGRWLQRLKGQTPHGEWGQTLADLRIGQRVAQVLMKDAADHDAAPNKSARRALLEDAEFLDEGEAEGGASTTSGESAPQQRTMQFEAPAEVQAPAPAAPSPPAVEEPLCSRCARCKRVGQPLPEKCADCRALRVQGRQDEPAPWDQAPGPGSAADAPDGQGTSQGPQEPSPGPGSGDAAEDEDVRPRDREGVLIPDHLRGTFDAVKDIAEWAQKANGLIAQLDDLFEAPGGVFLPTERAKDLIAEARSVVLGSVVSHVCPNCKGRREGCSFCLKCGCVPYAIWKG